MSTRILAACGGALWLAACSGSPAPETSAVSTNDPSFTTAAPEVSPAAVAQPERQASQTRATSRREVSASEPPAPVRSGGSPVAPPSPPVAEYREIVIPAGTIIPVSLATPVASDTSQIEEPVRATLREDITLVDGMVLPAGNELVGRITDVERSGRVKGRARVAFRFTLLKYDGDEYDVQTQAVERVAEATKRDDATKVGIGAGAGAALGAILGGGGGALKGAAVGAAAGTGAVLATRGEEVRLEAGTPLDTTLTSPLPLRVRLH